ncbi:hypothetical protein [Stenotrophomonas sp. UBA7606]|uniref:hypothetical protein n=1 Tax=Stenotrophomonas sp. UBA7606 TaxID=1947559 RepID=UPI0025D6C924|nr:hypothetical protein [Stenotrophomonas sp. UBA7606]
MGGKIRGHAAQGSARIQAAAQATGKPAQLSYPVFCLRHLQTGHDIEDLLADDQAALIKRFRTLSKMEWGQIEQAPRHGLGKENIAQTSIKRALPGVVTKDVKLWALRYANNKPMVGFRNGAVFHVLWIDHSFDVYNH